jgi:hypothetical protein
MNSMAFLLTQMYTDLTGRRVAVIDGDKLAKSEGKKAIGVYTVVEDDSPLLTRVDIPMLASLGGMLAGLPDAVVKQQVASSDISEMLSDAMFEVLNISAAVLSKRRAVLQHMITDAAKGAETVREMTQQPHRTTRFHVTPTGYTAGELAILAPLS